LATLVLTLSFTMVLAEGHTVSGSEHHGLLVVTRQVFVDSLTQYIQWKNSKGFDVYVVTAEWIQDHVDGADIKVRIRNCIRQYYREEGVSYVMLIGDSVDVSGPFNDEPPPPTLSENWNLPAGYYSWDSLNGTQYTSLYYSDLSDKVEYNATEWNYAGDYAIYVGIVPVRTPSELQIYLTKTINYYTCANLTVVVSGDIPTPDSEFYYSRIQSLAGSNISTDISFFGTNSSSEEIHEKIFDREAVIYESGHGNLQLFMIGNVAVTNENASDFRFINPLMLTSSCVVQAYNMYPECLDEAFLKAPKGPAVILNGPPWGPIGLTDDLSDLERGFWIDLFARKTIGQALYDHCNGAWQNPIHLFGDPSLVIFSASLSRALGGEILSVNMLQLLAPYLVYAFVVIGAILSGAKFKRRML